MKVYVIRRNNNTYYKRYFENYVQFEDEIAFAEIYTKKSGAENTMDFITRNEYRFNILPEELSVVEFYLMETKEITDYTKQVRREVVQELKEKIEKRNNGIRHSNHSEQYKDGYSGCCCELEEILDQIQGETK